MGFGANEHPCTAPLSCSLEHSTSLQPNNMLEVTLDAAATTYLYNIPAVSPPPLLPVAVPSKCSLDQTPSARFPKQASRTTSLLRQGQCKSTTLGHLLDFYAPTMYSLQLVSSLSPTPSHRRRRRSARRVKMFVVTFRDLARAAFKSRRSTAGTEMGQNGTREEKVRLHNLLLGSARNV